MNAHMRKALSVPITRIPSRAAAAHTNHTSHRSVQLNSCQSASPTDSQDSPMSVLLISDLNRYDVERRSSNHRGSVLADDPSRLASRLARCVDAADWYSSLFGPSTASSVTA